MDISEYDVDILLADDSAADIELVMKALGTEHQGWNIETARDGVEAITFVFGGDDDPGHELKHKPRLIVLDLNMPRIDGFQALERFKSDPRTREIPVVVLTSSPERKDMAKCFRLGGNDYKIKPVTFDFYIEMMQDITHRWLGENASLR